MNPYLFFRKQKGCTKDSFHVTPGLGRFILIFTVFVLNSSFNIAQEICNNGVDDDGDGLVDCADGDCTSDYISCPAFLNNNLSCPPGGIYADIIGTATGFKPDNGTTGPIVFNYPAGTESVRLVIQGNYQLFDHINDPNAGGTGNVDFEHGDDRLIYGIVEVNLLQNTSSGSVEYLSNMVLSSRYVWQDQPLGPNNTSTYVREGTNAIDLPDFEFVFNSTGSALEVTCLQGDVNLSYLATFYGNSAIESMSRVDGPNTTQYPAYFPAGATSQVIDLPVSGADFITISSMGVNQNRLGNFGTLLTNQKEEGNARKEVLIDLTTNLASGIITVGNGSIDDFCSTYAFDSYNVLAGGDVLNNGANIIGETSANLTGPQQIGRANPSFQITGGQLVITRDASFANDFNEIYYIKFYKRTGLPWSSGFKQLANTYISPNDIGYNSSGSTTFTIPNGTRYVSVFASGNGLFGGIYSAGISTLTPGRVTNENQVISYAEIDLLTNTHEGYNVMLATASNQQMYAWTDIAVDPTYDFAMFGPTVGQLPNSNDRINFDVNGNTLEVFFTNHNWAMERVVLVTFVGHYPDVFGDTIIQEFPQNGHCDSLYFSAVACNGGSQELNGNVPYSIYSTDPTSDPNSVLVASGTLATNWPVGQCDTFSFAVNTAFFPPVTGDVYIVFNDDGSLAAGTGNPIGGTFLLDDLVNGPAYIQECDEGNNLLSGNYEYIPLSPPDLGPDTLICGNFSMELNPILDSNYTYVWQDGSMDTLFTAISSGVYTVEVTDYRNCSESDTMNISAGTIGINLGNDTTICEGASIVLDATLPGATYLWQDASTAATLVVGLTGQYWVEVDQNGCLDADTINVTVNPIPLVDIGTDTTICDGETVILDAITPGATYLWQDGSSNATYTATATGSYWVQLEVNGCQNADTTEVIVMPLPIVDLGNPIDLCEGEQTVLGAFTPGATYEWSDGSTNAEITVNATGTYVVTVTENGCSGFDSVDVTVHPNPIVNLGPDQEACPGESVTFSANTVGVAYLWHDGSTNAFYTASGASESIWLQVSSAQGCIGSDTVAFIVSSLPEFVITGEETVCEETTLLYAPSGYTEYLWSDGSTGQNLSVNTPGQYTLTITNESGCSATEIWEVENGCIPVLWLPNAFTPDHDEFNQTFQAIGTPVESFEMLIFNRWGEIVWESYDISVGWNGTGPNGRLVSDGVYTWKVNYSYYDNTRLITDTLLGHVTVIR